MFSRYAFLIVFPLLLISGVALASFAYLKQRPIAVVEQAPGLYFDRAEHDFGAVAQGSVLKVEFVLTNRYSGAVEVTKVAGGCSCEDVSIDKTQLQQGESARIAVTWRVASARHRIREHVNVTHTLPAGEKHEPHQLKVSITADVVPDIEVAPKELMFDAGQPAMATIQLSPGTRRTFKIERVSCAAAFLKFTTDHVTQSIIVEYSPTSVNAVASQATIVIQTDSINQTRLSIPVAIQVSKPKPAPGATR